MHSMDSPKLPLLGELVERLSIDWLIGNPRLPFRGSIFNGGGILRLLNLSPLPDEESILMIGDLGLLGKSIVSGVIGVVGKSEISELAVDMSILGPSFVIDWNDDWLSSVRDDGDGDDLVVFIKGELLRELLSGEVLPGLNLELFFRPMDCRKLILYFQSLIIYFNKLRWKCT